MQHAAMISTAIVIAQGCPAGVVAVFGYLERVPSGDTNVTIALTARQRVFWIGAN